RPPAASPEPACSTARQRARWSADRSDLRTRAPPVAARRWRGWRTPPGRGTSDRPDRPPPRWSCRPSCCAPGWWLDEGTHAARDLVRSEAIGVHGVGCQCVRRRPGGEQGFDARKALALGRRAVSVQQRTIPGLADPAENLRGRGPQADHRACREEPPAILGVEQGTATDGDDRFAESARLLDRGPLTAPERGLALGREDRRYRPSRAGFDQRIGIDERAPEVAREPAPDVRLP